MSSRSNPLRWQYGLCSLRLALLTAWCCALGVVWIQPLAAQTQTTVGLNPSQNWIGYMNVFDLPSSAGGDGAYQTNSGVWATADLTASFDGSTLTLGPNHISDPSTTWYVGGGAPGAAGNKIMDANMYVQNDALAGDTITFTAHTVSNTLAGTLPAWEVSGVQPFTTVAFIKDFNASYALVNSTTTPLTPGQDFSITLATTPGDHIQYGFETVGPDIWSNDVSQVGTVALTPVGNQVATLPANVLSNPGFESDPAGETRTFPGWTAHGANALSETSSTVALTGVHYLKTYQDFTVTTPNTCGVYQDYISGQGATYAADGWAETLSSDQLAGQNSAWIEVSFRDAQAHILALYRSAVITNVAGGNFPADTWVDLPVTNQVDPATSAITNTVSQLVAPPGTYFVRYQVLFRGDGNQSTGSVYFDDLQLTPTGRSPIGDWNIVWDDEFNGASINHNLWTYDTGNSGWGNQELEYYTSRTNNAYEAGGLLHIVARQESYGGSSFTSARLKSQGLFSCKYGRIQWRAKLPQGVGCWPALWLLGNNISTSGWPGCGEIDVMENNGTNPKTVQGSLHSGSNETGYYNFPTGDAASAFHTYTLDWTTNAILFYVDGHLYESQTSWSSSYGSYPFPYNQPFFFIMNLAIGGNYVGNPSSSAISAGTAFPAQMEVDYLRVYRPTAPLKLTATVTPSGLRLAWPSNVVCHLQELVNPADGLQSTNWVDVPTTSNPVVIAPSNQSTFYRIQSP